jgi:hypothetical protein
MLKVFIAVILLPLLLIKGSTAKEDNIVMTELRGYTTKLDNAIGNCTTRPAIEYKMFTVNPPVSQ